MRKVIFMAISFAILSMQIFAAYAFAGKDILAQMVSYNIFFNEKEQMFENPIVTINEKTYVPLREVAEKLGMRVDWDANEQSITITNDPVTPNSTPYPFESNGLWGYKNTDGTIVVEPTYDAAEPFSEGRALVMNSSGQNGQYGFIDVEGTLVIPCVYYMAYSFSDGAALVSLSTQTDEDCWTYIDKNGNRLFDKEFTLARSFSENYAVVLKSGIGAAVPPGVSAEQRWSYINKNGDFATELDFEEARDFQEGQALVKNNGKWGVIDKQFNLVIPYLYDEIKRCDDGTFNVRQNDNWFYIDSRGNTVD